ncbi:hypothetical protein FA15DRAFT_670378 [Coprinopsis marcescibilis]|uniref:Uncharacterized protein n=1 Tax=Coprinopsis marcescibilis TaxID=230819 RepID=A0A5C3KSI4_COPMA|nr:hypothetical protein FA15DRAFT_670378 [Coprinopsis marcescibilis]
MVSAQAHTPAEIEAAEALVMQLDPVNRLPCYVPPLRLMCQAAYIAQQLESSGLSKRGQTHKHVNQSQFSRN